MKGTNTKDVVAMVVNEKIRFPSMQLIDQHGVNIGIVQRIQALRMAQEAGLDLVVLSEQGKEGVPVVKIMDLGKELYERKKKQVEAKKHQKVIQIKEVKIRPKIGEHDYQTKMKQAIQFLLEGKRLKITLFFRGRENVAKEVRGNELFAKIQKTFDDADLTKNLIQEKDMREGQMWSRVYYLKNSAK